MMKALTEFLSAGLKAEQPKVTLQGGDSGTQPFAETMDALLASTADEPQKLTSMNELTDSALDGIKVPADSQLPSQMANLTAGRDSKTPTGNLAEQPRHLNEAETKHQLTDDFTMNITTPGQDAPKAVQEAATSSTLPSQVIAANDLVDSHGIPAGTVMAEGSLDSHTGIAATYAEISQQQLTGTTSAQPSNALTSDGRTDQGSLTVQGGFASPSPVQSGVPNEVIGASLPTDITLNMVEAGRKFAGHSPESPGNMAPATTTTALISSANTASVATRELVGVENSLARTEGTVRGADLLGLGERLPLSQVSDRLSVDPRLDVESDRAAVASSAAVFKTELTARQPVSFDAGIKLSNTEPQQFAGEMATHVRVLKSQSGGEVKLNLHPAELGRMSISVSTEGNETRVAFVVETSQARQAVETALPRLRDMLENAGLSLSDSDVSEQRNPQAETADSRSGSSREETTSPDGKDVSATTVLSVTVDPDRLVDTYI
jgi:flagellar hook-length control protein FliK